MLSAFAHPEIPPRTPEPALQLVERVQIDLAVVVPKDRPFIGLEELLKDAGHGVRNDIGADNAHVGIPSPPVVEAAERVRTSGYAFVAGGSK